MDSHITAVCAQLITEYDSVTSTPELEARITGLNEHQFHHLLDFHRKKFEAQYTEECCLMQPNGDRYLLNQKILQRKTPVSKRDFTEYNLRIALSSEETKPLPLMTPEMLTNSNPSREKKRWSFDVDSVFRLDMTVATMSGKVSYEVELEAKQKPTAQHLAFAIQQLLQYTQRSYYVLPNATLDQIVQRIPKNLKGAQPRTLQQFHLSIIHQQPYAFTIKLDGVRSYLLVIGIYLVLVDGIGPRVLRSHEWLREWEGIIIEGELLCKGGEEETFWAFDLLDAKRGTTVRNNPHFKLKERIEYIQCFNELLPKDFIKIKEYHTDIKEVRGILEKYKDVPTDGLICVPVNELYPDETKWEHLFKWKPEVTIDMRYSQGQWLVGAPTNTEIPFKPVDYPEACNATHVTNVANGTIMECQWKDNRFVPIRERPDKVVPNFLNVALDNMYAIQNPVSLGELCGEEYAVDMAKPTCYEFIANSSFVVDAWFDVPVREHKAQKVNDLMNWLGKVATAPPAVIPPPVQTTVAPVASSATLKMKVPELKMYLQSNGLPVKGKRADLVQRVLDHMAKK